MWRSTSVEAQTCLQGVTRFLKRCASDVQLKIGSESHKWTRGHSSQQDHVILCLSVKKHYPSSKSIRIYESRCYKHDQATVSIAFLVENLHATPKMKHSAPSLRDYCRDLGNVTRESIKVITNWSTKYFTHWKSHCPFQSSQWTFLLLQNKANSSSGHGQDEGIGK